MRLTRVGGTRPNETALTQRVLGAECGGAEPGHVAERSLSSADVIYIFMATVGDAYRLSGLFVGRQTVPKAQRSADHCRIACSMLVSPRLVFHLMFVVVDLYGGILNEC